MSQLNKETFICLDCETTGLDIKQDRVIEVSATRFTIENNIETYETLIDPKVTIPQESIDIHHITQDMVEGQPTIDTVLAPLFEFIGDEIIVGHGITFDLNILHEEAQRHRIRSKLDKQKFIDTLRLARLYGESPVNSLQGLRKHFNIAEQMAHRAGDDVLINIEVFKHLVKSFRSKKEIIERLKSPILMQRMPLGKHKGRLFKEIPLAYLKWARHQKFDIDLMHSIETELKKRRRGNNFLQASNPFGSLKL